MTVRKKSTSIRLPPREEEPWIVPLSSFFFILSDHTPQLLVVYMVKKTDYRILSPPSLSDKNKMIKEGAWKSSGLWPGTRDKWFSFFLRVFGEIIMSVSFFITSDFYRPWCGKIFWYFFFLNKQLENFKNKSRNFFLSFLKIIQDTWTRGGGQKRDRQIKKFHVRPWIRISDMSIDTDNAR